MRETDIVTQCFDGNAAFATECTIVAVTHQSSHDFRFRQHDTRDIHVFFTMTARVSSLDLRVGQNV